MANLIVDFPGSNHCSSKTVSFSPFAEGVYIKYPSARENRERWYSKEDQVGFKHIMVRDAVECSFKLTSRDNSELTANNHTCCAGLDHLISRDVSQRYQYIKARRKEHACAVLNEQAEQRRRNTKSSDKLALVSSKSSEWSRVRSHKVAQFLGTMEWCPQVWHTRDINKSKG